MKKEIRSLTGIRGLAALYVACYHFFDSSVNLEPTLFTSFLGHGYNAVDLFFILSGFVMALSSEKLVINGFNTFGFVTFMKRRFTRIYPVYIFFTLLYFVIIFKCKGWTTLFFNGLLIQSFLRGDGSIIIPGWSLSAEWIAYLLFPFFLLLVNKFRKQWWLATMILLSFVLLFIVSQNNTEWFNGFRPLPDVAGTLDRYRGFSSLTRCFSEYVFGIAIYKIYTTYFTRYSNYFHYAAIPAALLAIFLLFVPDSDLALVFLFGVLVFSTSTDKGPVAGILSSAPVYFLGEISYSLYLAHTLVFHIDKLIIESTFEGAYLSYWNIGITLAVLIVLSYLCYRFIEIPARNYLRNRLESPAEGRVSVSAR